MKVKKLYSLPRRRSRFVAIAVCLLLTLATGSFYFPTPAPVRAATAELFFSEYIEGSSNNKALEIYNGTGAPINLGANGYNVQMFFNGNPVSTLTINLTGTVADGDVFVLAQSSANATILAQADQTNGSGWFNGDDAVVLRKGTTIIDSIGQIGNDPGTEWGSGLTSTADNTIRRKAAICAGDANGTDAFSPAAEWDGFATDTFDGLGAHNALCGADAAPSVDSTTPASGATDVAVNSDITVNFSEPVNVTGEWFTITGSNSGAHTATVTGGPTSFTLNPDTDFAVGEGVSVTIVAAQVTDQDSSDPPDAMQTNFTWTFSTPAPALAINQIQGSASASPFVGQNVKTSGIVTAVKSNGFFLQTPDANVDADPLTSEGIFVFTSSAPAVSVGNAATVTGAVTEFFNLTQLGLGGNPASVVVDSSGNPLPAALTVTTAMLNPAGPLNQLERFEGMRLHADTLVSVAPTNQFGEIFTVLDGVARPFREPGIEIVDPVPPGAPAGVPRFDLNPERLMVDTDGLAGSTRLEVTSLVTLANVTGPLDFTFSNYKILPESTPIASPNIVALAVPDANCDEFTVGSFNLENFTSATNATRMNKASLAIRNVMRSPDIIGVEEVGTLAVLQTLANKINLDSVAAGQPNPQYQAYLIDSGANANDTNIDVGFLVKSSRVAVTSVTQEGADETFINPNTGQPELLNDRPPLILRANVQPAAGVSFPVTVIVNHLRSLICIEADPTAPNCDLNDGPRVRAKRQAQAEYLANLVQSLQSENLVLVGDFNAFQFNDGYVDLIGTISGVPTPADEVVLASPDLVNPDLTDLVNLLPPDQRYSFIFEGNPQVLDHVLVDADMLSRLSRFAYARNNADFPENLRSVATRPERLSDHDMPVAYFKLPPSITNVSTSRTVIWPPNHKMVNVTVNYDVVSPCPVTCTLTVTSNEPVDGEDDGSTSPDWEIIDAHNVRLRAERSGEGTGRIYTITITCTDSSGNSTSQTATVTVPLNQD
ncbi:MAG TPA: Ig-like domain-containing protein [Blastocatellia bacterium]|nr:Ig-like domain-containing protein [Blastocatellia bacterium]